MKKILLIITMLAAGLVSCRQVSSFLHDGDVVAKVGDHKLYASQLAQYIPAGISSEDSTHLALSYINKWASDMVFMDMADAELSKSEKDVTEELEAYRLSLLKYRYEQKYVNQRLDTAIAASQIEKYYNDHKDNFRLDRPIVKARFVCIALDSPNIDAVRKNLAGSDDDQLIVADSLTYASSLKYTDFGGKWIDIITLSSEFGTDYREVLSSVKKGYVEMEDGKGGINIAYISDMIKTGEQAPVEYWSPRIKDIILSSRKQTLLSGLERDLLEKARGQNNLVIY